VLHLADLTERTLTEVEITKAEAQRLREGYEGKRAVKADRRVLSKARIITGEHIIQLREERQAKDLRRPNPRPTKKTNPLPLPSTPAVCSLEHQVARVQIVDTPEVIQLHDTSSKFDDSYESSDYSDTPAPTPSHYPILSPVLNTPVNPNRRLPNRLLEMRLRSRR